jgi:hypothetical protein
MDRTDLYIRLWSIWMVLVTVGLGYMLLTM